MWDSTKLEAVHGSGGTSHDFAEINGDEASVLYRLNRPYEVQIGKAGAAFETVNVPDEFMKLPGALRDPRQGDSARVWRWDQEGEFIEAIREERDCRPSFYDGYVCQKIMDAVLQSNEERRWVDID